MKSIIITKEELILHSRNTDHLQACQKYRSTLTKNKKKVIARKQKYKNNFENFN